MNIYITAIIKSKPEFTTEVKAFLLNLLEQSRKEKAAILYQLHQSIEDENTFFFYENWENQEGLNEHNKQPYFVEFQKVIQEKVQELSIVKAKLLK
ncbi:antibiotic biosynthesis monooxygenase [Pedobacter sp. BS3]|uniref:putative quinol monooxygenase n=1 Tax=Pedobacter sp. BS3 TaxID=2567937 RepID=UPI0011F025C7|nr:putative quinol monooxygenase [Pedobacter sp. BS3]TZF83560.1 antibiotic biosynthesis monooxygenase [Pedobacter sp. BS3]